MKVKKVLDIILVLIILFNTNSICQQFLQQKSMLNNLEIKDVTDLNKVRRFYFQASVGMFEYFSVGFGYQINPSFAFSLKHANTWVSGHGGNSFLPPSGSGLGIDVKYFTDLWIFNNISFGYIYYLYVPNIYDEKYGIKPKGIYYEVVLGKESIQNGVTRKPQIFWSIGIGKSFNKNYDKTLIILSIKIGISHNLF